jgi:hypothetical protein
VNLPAELGGRYFIQSAALAAETNDIPGGIGRARDLNLSMAVGTKDCLADIFPAHLKGYFAMRTLKMNHCCFSFYLRVP